jgi:PhnB protein
MPDKNITSFAPELYIPHGVKDVTFYSKAFGAIELRRFTNDDASIHVVEFSIDGNLFHLHEDSDRLSAFNPARNNATTAIIGLFVADVDAVMDKALAAGATEISPAQDYDYGYRQGQLKDPFGHIWMIEKKI